MTKRIVSKYIDSNVFIFERGGECVIFDAGAELKFVEDALNELKNPKVLGVFLTHGHYDHCFYAEDYAQKFGCKIFCSQNAKEYLENSNYNYSEGHFELDNFSNFEFLTGSGSVKFENFQIKYYQLAGHSKSDMVFQIDKEIFVGDLLIGRDMGRIDLYGGNKIEMKNSLEFLLNLDYETMHSGHGQDNTKSVQDKVIKLWVKFLSR